MAGSALKLPTTIAFQSFGSLHFISNDIENRLPIAFHDYNFVRFTAQVVHQIETTAVTASSIGYSAKPES
ncbi:MAG: hypothetical protein AMJ54_06670 [Deltaproteobacteria bacterium SG8_13]|nr:MAG: hypothetical protein AMJ54_06670 [Deltaproteobacteria bacterium SG8_13]